MQGDLMVLRPMEKFLGRERAPGEVIDAAELANVSEAVIEANVSQGLLGEPEGEKPGVGADQIRAIVRAEIEALLPGLRDSIVAVLKGAKP